LILRCYESTGQPGLVRIAMPDIMGFDAAHRTDLLENSQTEIAVENNTFQTEIRPYSIETFKLIKD
jgi:alpha-mannosidase